MSHDPSNPDRSPNTLAADARVYSDRLGPISDAQFAAAAARLGLGAFVSAEPIQQGLFGQNVFLTTTEGAFVFRGAPHWSGGRRDDRVQFFREAHFIRLAADAGAPAPWPCHYDPTADIFGWPYLVMPRLPGDCLNERNTFRALPAAARREVAASMGSTLARLQRIGGPCAGELDVDTGEIAPDPGGYAGHLAQWIAGIARGAEATLTDADLAWTDGIVAAAAALPLRAATFVHGDYKLDNMTVAERDGAWRVTGLFDFHTARFGDSARDLVRAGSNFLDTEPELARVFVEAWREGGGDVAALAAWLPLYVASERITIWPGFVRGLWGTTPRAGETFRSWAERYLEQLLALIQGTSTAAPLSRPARRSESASLAASSG